MSIINPILNHNYDIIDKDLFKNCKGKLTLGNYEYNIEELLKKFNFNKSNHSNDNFLTLLKSLSVVGMKIYEDNISCNRNNKGVLICTTNLSNIIHINKISDNNNPDYLLLENNNIKKKLVCKMKNTFTFTISEQSKFNYEQNYSELRNYIVGQLDNKFLFLNDNYLITCSNNDLNQTKPTRMEMLLELKSFYITNVDEIDKYTNSLQLNKLLDLFYNLINEMIFYYLPKNFFVEFNKIDDKYLDYFKKIKINITNFVKRLFFVVFREKAESLFNNVNLKINISINNDNITYIYFYLFNTLNQTLNIPYYNIYNSIDINDLIFYLENKINFLDSFYNFIDETKAYNDELECKKIFSGVKDWIEYDFTAKPINNTREYINLITLQKNIDKIKILNYYPKLNKYHENCTIAVNIELDNKFYYISIMSITMEEFNKIGSIGNTNKFKEDYINNLKKIISENDTRKNIVINTTLPSMLKVMITQYENKPNLIKNFYINETESDYNKTALPVIKAAVTDPYLILPQLWLSEYRNILNKYNYLDKLFFIEKYIPTLNQDIKEFIELTKSFMKIDSICFVILSVIDFTDNFILINKISNITELISFYHKKKNSNLYIDRQELLDKINYLACNILNYEKYIKINKEELDILLDELFNDIVTDEKFYLFISKYIKKTQFSYIIWYISKDLKITNSYNTELLYKELKNDKKPILNLLDIINQSLINDIYTKPDFKIKDILEGYERIYLTNNSNEKEKVFSKRDIIKMISNFYILYDDDSFPYNIRHFNKDHYKEMKNLLIKTQKYDLLIFCHYPNFDQMSILHWHIYPDYYQTDDIIGKKIDTGFIRIVLFDKVNSENNIYKNKNIIISLPIKTKTGNITIKDIEGDENYRYKIKLSRKNIMFKDIMLSDIERNDINPLLCKLKEQDKQVGGKNYYKLYNKYKNKYINLKNNNK